MKPRYKCPICKTRFMAVVVANPTCPRLSCNKVKLNVYAGKKKLGFRQFGKFAENAKLQHQARHQQVSKLRNAAPVKYGKQEADDDEYENDNDKLATLKLLKQIDDEEADRETEDFDFVPNCDRWDFDQRLTIHDMAVRNLFPPTVSLKQIEGRITAPVDGERQKQCGSIMGCHLKFTTVSAFGVSNLCGVPIGKRWRKGEKDTAEWCHLIGVSLGGVTKHDNLCAASYCANTFMGVIEKFIHARTDLYVCVKVEGTKHANAKLQPLCEHVAELIEYRIFDMNTKKQLIKFDIDARISGFSAKNRDEVTKLLKDAIKPMNKH
jgi:hypothetical protein